MIGMGPCVEGEGVGGKGGGGGGDGPYSSFLSFAAENRIAIVKLQRSASE